jgi:kynureninase
MTSRDTAERLDRADPLAWVRKDFALGDGQVYLNGHSLGVPPAGVRDTVGRTIAQQWGDDLVRGRSGECWSSAPRLVGDRIGRLLGAAPGQTLVGDSTSVQLFNAVGAAARLRPDRRLIMVDSCGFPTDRYLAGSVARMLGLELRQVPAARFPEALAEYGGQVAVTAAGPVDLRTGEMSDIRALTAAAHRAGAVAVWDLCQVTGAVPLALDADLVDLAVGCGEAFLSGGPGAPAYIYAAARHHGALDLPLTGCQEPAASTTAADDGIARLRIGSPPLLSLVALDAALDAYDGLDPYEIRAKSVELGAFFIDCVEELLDGLGFELATPRAAERRASQLLLRHCAAPRLMRALHDRGVIGDVPAPDLLRFGYNALHVTYCDVFDAVEALRAAALREAGRHEACRRHDPAPAGASTPVPAGR